jgi:hypothetical protein
MVPLNLLKRWEQDSTGVAAERSWGSGLACNGPGSSTVDTTVDAAV